MGFHRDCFGGVRATFAIALRLPCQLVDAIQSIERHFSGFGTTTRQMVYTLRLPPLLLSQGTRAFLLAIYICTTSFSASFCLCYPTMGSDAILWSRTLRFTPILVFALLLGHVSSTSCSSQLRLAANPLCSYSCFPI